METFISNILRITGYRFRKNGFFGRFGIGRRGLRVVGIRCGVCNLRADFRE